MLQLQAKKPVSYWLFFVFITSYCLMSCSKESENSHAHEKLRIITLAPHLAELVASAGALDNLIGVVSYSDFPSQVKQLPHVGDAFKIDYESIIRLNPDIILVWKGGTPQAVINKLKSLKLKLIETEIKKLDDIGKTIADIAKLTHTEAIAEKNIKRFEKKLQELKNNHAQHQSLFLEISAQPLYTVSKQHWMSEAASVCGYENIFANLTQLSAPVTFESVISKNPQAILTIAQQTDKQWQQWTTLKAVANKQIFTISPDYFSRPTLRIVHGIEQLCGSNNS